MLGRDLGRYYDHVVSDCTCPPLYTVICRVPRGALWAVGMARSAGGGGTSVAAATGPQADRAPVVRGAVAVRPAGQLLSATPGNGAAANGASHGQQPAVVAVRGGRGDRAVSLLHDSSAREERSSTADFRGPSRAISQERRCH